MIGSPFEAIEHTLIAFKLIKKDMIKLKQFLDNLQTQKQNEMKDLTKILKDGDEVYFTMTGEMIKVIETNSNLCRGMGGILKTPIEIEAGVLKFALTKYGQIYEGGECLIFPSKEERNWDNFKRKEEFKRGDLCAFWSINITHKVVGIFCDEEGGEYFSASISDGEISRHECWDNCEKINIEDYI